MAQSRFYAADDSQTDTTAKVWEVKSGENIATLGHQQKVTEIAFSPDGSRVATASGKRVNMWCTKTWKAIVTLNTVEVESLAFSSGWHPTCDWRVQVPSR